MILEITRGHIKLKIQDKHVTILGEALLPGYGSPDFIVYTNSIEHWDDNQNTKISPEEKDLILQVLKEDTKERNLAIELE